MPLVGLEPTRENSPDFESGASAIPPQRHKQKILNSLYKILNYLSILILKNVKYYNFKIYYIKNQGF